MFPVVIPVAGLGTRSLPASKVIPKELLPVYDRPIIQFVVEEAQKANVKDVVFVTSSGKSAIEDHFDIQPALEQALKDKGKSDLLEEVQKVSRMVNVQSVRQKEPLGLGHAVLQAEPSISSSHFFVMLGDEMTDAEVPSLQQLLNIYQRKQSTVPEAGVILLMNVADEDVSKYGICEWDENSHQISRCVEKPQAHETQSRAAITGRYLLPYSVFEKIKSQPQGKLGEIQLTDALNALAQEGKLFGCLFEGTRIDAGDRMGYLQAHLHYYLRSPFAEKTKELMRSYLS